MNRYQNIPVTKTDTGKAESELYRIIHTFNPSEIICCGAENTLNKNFSKILKQ